MREGSFQSVVKMELQFWLETNAKAMRRIYGAIAEAVAPAVAAELQRGVLKRLGQLEPDERDEVAGILAECSYALDQASKLKPKFDDASDSLRARCDELAARLGAQVHAERRVEPMGGPKKEDF